MAYQFDGYIYYRAHKRIIKGMELLVGCYNQYLERLLIGTKMKTIIKNATKNLEKFTGNFFSYISSRLVSNLASNYASSRNDTYLYKKFSLAQRCLLKYAEDCHLQFLLNSANMIFLFRKKRKLDGPNNCA